MPGALDDLRVIELGGGEGVALCGRFFAELGAQVIKVEPPEGDPLRRIPPLRGGSSYLFEMLASGKRSLVLDLDEEEGQSMLRSMLAHADVLLEGYGGQAMSARGLDYRAVHAANPRLIYCSLSAFGDEGSDGRYPGSDIVVQAKGGLMNVHGFASDPPCKSGPALADFAGALVAAIGVLAALYHRDNGGHGQRVDISAQDCVVFMLDSAITSLYFTGKAPPRQGNRHPLIAPHNAYRASDGWLVVSAGSDDQWRRLSYAMGRGYLAADGRYAHARERTARVEEVDAIVSEWTATRTVSEVVEKLAAADVPSGPVRGISELLRDPRLVNRDMVVEVAHPDGTLRIPGSMFKMSSTPGLCVRPAPVLGECQPVDIAPHSLSPEPAIAPSRPEATGPLTGLKVLELANFAAGPIGPRLLSDLGAEVIKVEPPDGGDGMRRSPPLTNGVSCVFQTLNCGKLGLTLDLSLKRGSAILRDLARDADVVFDNCAVGTKGKLGLDYESLASLNQRMIYCSVSGFGQTGPHCHGQAADQIIQARSGLMSLSGWEGGPPQRLGIGALDYLGPMVGVAAILAALHYRHRTGDGQGIDISMSDVGGFLTYSAWPAYFEQGVALQRYGNRYPFAAPYNAYPSRDGMVVIGVTTDEQWRGLTEAMEEQGVHLPPRYTSTAQRLMARDEIDEVVAAWVASQSAKQLLSICSAHGVPAGPVVDISHVVLDSHLSDREMLVTVKTTKAGPVIVTGSPVKMSATPARVRGPAPELGQHTAAILAARLHCRAAEVARLREERVI